MIEEPPIRSTLVGTLFLHWVSGTSHKIRVPCMFYPDHEYIVFERVSEGWRDNLGRVVTVQDMRDGSCPWDDGR